MIDFMTLTMAVFEVVTLLTSSTAFQSLVKQYFCIKSETYERLIKISISLQFRIMKMLINRY